MVACRQSSHDRTNGRSPDNPNSMAPPRMDRAPIRRKGGIDCRPSAIARYDPPQSRYIAPNAPTKCTRPRLVDTASSF
jgi:hypothetical protein